MYFKFQYVRGDIHIHIDTENIILTFLSNRHIAWQNALLACMHWESIGNFKDKICQTG